MKPITWGDIQGRYYFFGDARDRLRAEGGRVVVRYVTQHSS
jgi:hypothetical protein